MSSTVLQESFDRADQALRRHEHALQGTAPELASVLPDCIDLMDGLMRAWLAEEGRAPPAPGSDVLEVWKALVKGEPTWNTIRDNLRELVYYRNCLAMDRADALPANPAHMAVRTARHIWLYMRTRAERLPH
jgi:hypothetical protein